MATAPLQSYIFLLSVLNLATAELGWQWTQGAGGPVNDFRIHQGSLGDSFTDKIVSGSLRQYPLRNIVPGPGAYSMLVEARNISGPAPDSEQLIGDVVSAVAPSAPTNLRLV